MIVQSFAVATAGAFLDVRHCDPNRIISVADWHPKKTTFDKRPVRKRGYPLGGARVKEVIDWLNFLGLLSSNFMTRYWISIWVTHTSLRWKKKIEKIPSYSLCLTDWGVVYSVLDEILSNNHLTGTLCKMIEAIRLYTSSEMMMMKGITSNIVWKIKSRLD